MNMQIQKKTVEKIFTTFNKAGYKMIQTMSPGRHIFDWKEGRTVIYGGNARKEMFTSNIPPLTFLTDKKLSETVNALTEDEQKAIRQELRAIGEIYFPNEVFIINRSPLGSIYKDKNISQKPINGKGLGDHWDNWYVFEVDGYCGDDLTDPDTHWGGRNNPVIRDLKLYQAETLPHEIMWLIKILSKNVNYSEVNFDDWNMDLILEHKLAFINKAQDPINVYTKEYAPQSRLFRKQGASLKIPFFIKNTALLAVSALDPVTILKDTLTELAPQVTGELKDAIDKFISQDITQYSGLLTAKNLMYTGLRQGMTSAFLAKDPNTKNQLLEQIDEQLTNAINDYQENFKVWNKISDSMKLNPILTQHFGEWGIYLSDVLVWKSYKVPIKTRRK